MKFKNLMARALYDNVPETAEELAFRKGDILTVIEQNTGGLEGWWLCSIHGRQGIAPGNRLKLLIGPMFDNCSNQHSSYPTASQQSFQQQVYQAPGSQVASSWDSVYQVPPSHQNQSIYQVPMSQSSQGQDIYQVPPSVQRSGFGVNTSSGISKVVTPIRVGQGYIYESPSTFQKDTYDIPPTRTQGIYSIPPSTNKDGALTRDRTYDILPSMRHKPEGVYDIPPTSCKTPVTGFNLQPNYDILPSADLVARRQDVYDIPPSHQNAQAGHHQASPKDAYDIPKGVQSPRQQNHERTGPEGRDGVYDIPPQVTQDTKGMQDVTDGMNRLSFSSTGSTRSNMSTSSTTSKESSVSISPSSEKKLLLDLDSAIERLSWLQHGIDASVTELLAFVDIDWRSYESMEKQINEIHAAVDKVKQALMDFVEFAKGAAANALSLSDLSLYNKLKRQLQRLDDSHQILIQTSQALDNCNWSLNQLSISKPQSKCDDLDRFVMVTKTVPDDVKQLASSISTGAEFLFKVGTSRSSSEKGVEDDMNSADYVYNSPQPHLVQGEKTIIQTSHLHTLPGKDQKITFNSGDSSGKSWLEDYDYVHLQGKEEFERQQKELLEKENIVKQSKTQLEQNQLSQFQQLEKEVTQPVENDISKWKPPQAAPQASSSLCSLDRQLLLFYSEQCETHFISLLNAIDAFFSCITASQPPRIFVAHSKFVILSAHKLVFIGDTLSRQTTTQDIRNKVMNCSNQLCELLKNIVSATKVAALHYPNTAALQEMVDRVTELSSHAQLFKLTLVQMTSS
ncbi:enhancer of filamentation 1 isoform X2 [Latimeria chalumnae]|uniref:enhancer of filamentation 1 isoform X2 n=1 Tax=Latimeria chalumnae TaxID=7897 RepID=UPI0003C11296|nr:PREDICTED: enhancer of filamentation 1 isoform X2 [Latimeria chalumnae]|eukprot:XP_006006447.1 PREDICTED: enhancer of filamentation 1 isoform X2 [Latimeria chalumnae]